MILMPYTVTALAESDAEGTSGKNIVENSAITLTTLADVPVTMYDDAAGLNPQTTKYTNTSGYKIIWIESGTYKLTVNSTLTIIEAALDSRPYGIAVEEGIAWPNGADLTDFTDVFPFVNYTLNLSTPYTGAGLPSALNGSDIDATLIYEGNLNGFGIFRLIDVATGNVWIKTWNNQVTQVDWQLIGATVVLQQTTDFAVHDAMYSWWTNPKTIRYTDDDRDWTFQSFTNSKGAVGVIIHNHRDRNTRKYILDDSGRIADDHNAGCICVGNGKVVAVYGGRSNNPAVAPNNECLVCEWDITNEPNPANVTKYYLGVGRDYPVIYQYDGDVILIASQRGGNTPVATTGHAFMTNTWPLGSGAGSWSAKTPLTNYVAGDPGIMPDWMYMTARRNADDPSIIDMIWGFHPFPVNQPLANIYKSQIRHVGGASPWRFYVNGSEIANLSTGVGLPIELADLELAYTAAVGERTRPYDVKGDGFVFTTYTTDASLSTYRYGYKTGGVWTSVEVAHCGDPFYKGSSFYFGGAAISENDDVITIAQNNQNTLRLFSPAETGDDRFGDETPFIPEATDLIDVEGDWRFVDLRSTDGGATWNELQSYSLTGDNKGGLIHGRPHAEHASLYNRENNSTAVYQILGWVGHYSINSFNDYASSIISLAPRPKAYTPDAHEFNGAVIASVDNASDGDKQVFLGSEYCVLSERERQVVAACSDVQMTTRNSFAGGARRVQFTGTGDASGATSTWLMGVVGVTNSTIAKNYSFMGGCDNIEFGIADVDEIICNGAVAAQNINTGTNASFNFFGGSRDCDSFGDFVGAVASDACDANSVNSAFVSFSAADTCVINGGDFAGFVSSDLCTVYASGAAITIDGVGATTTSGDGYRAFFGASTSCVFGSSNASTSGRSAFIASNAAQNTERRTYQIGCTSSAATSEANGIGSGILSSVDCINNGANSVIIGGNTSVNNASNSVLVGASRTILNSSVQYASDPDLFANGDNSIAGGYSASGAASAANLKWLIDGQAGDMYLAGTLTQNATFSDIAKMVKNGEGQEIEVGYMLTLIGDKVYKAKAGESVDGIVPATPSMIHNDTPFQWQGRYLTDDFGRVLKEPKEFVRWGEIEEIYDAEKVYPANVQIKAREIEGLTVTYATLSGYDGLLEDAPEIPDGAEFYTMQVPIENPEYDPTVTNTKRSERPDEWTVVGVHGFIRTRVDETVTQQAVDDAALLRKNVYIEPSAVDGVGMLSATKTNIQVMSVEKEYNGDYGVALCYFKGAE